MEVPGRHCHEDLRIRQRTSPQAPRVELAQASDLLAAYDVQQAHVIQTARFGESLFDLGKQIPLRPVS
jgi:hypothetical protein